LIDRQTAVFLAPAAIALLGDIRFLAGDGETLALCRPHLNLAQHQHDLFRARLLSSLHPQRLRSWLILSISPVQSQPVRSLNLATLGCVKQAA
jgi:hypothetical protein